MKKYQDNLLIDRALLTDLIIDKNRPQQNWKNFISFVAGSYKRILYEPIHASALEVELRSFKDLKGKLVAISNGGKTDSEETKLLKQTLKAGSENLSILQAIQNYEMHRKGPARPKEEILGYIFRLLLLAREHKADIASWPSRTPIILSLMQEAGIRGNFVINKPPIRFFLTEECQFPFLPKVERKESNVHFGFLVIDEVILMQNKTFGVKPILFVAADPTDAARLRIGEEAREIGEKLQMALLRDAFVFEQRFSTRPEDLTQALLDVKPTIVHFSGHGMETGAICLEDKNGRAHPIDPGAIASLFKQFTRNIECIVLNACYSEEQAIAIAQHIKYVIGMNSAIGDKAAIAFSIGFYQALGSGRSIVDAFDFGCTQIRLQGIPEYLTPVLHK